MEKSANFVTEGMLAKTHKITVTNTLSDWVILATYWKETKRFTENPIQ